MDFKIIISLFLIKATLVFSQGKPNTTTISTAQSTSETPAPPPPSSSPLTTAINEQTTFIPSSTTSTNEQVNRNGNVSSTGADQSLTTTTTPPPPPPLPPSPPRQVYLLDKETTTEKEHILDHVHTPLAEALNVIFTWADTHFPLTVKLLKVSKTMTDTQIKQIPGAAMLLDILAEATQYHKLKNKLEPGQDYSNYTIEKMIDEFSKHHNYSLKDIPIISDIGEKVSTIPAVRDLIKNSLTTSVNGAPFALTLMSLIQHIATEISVSQLSNSSVIHEVRKNITKEFNPFLKIHVNRTLIRLKNHTSMVISNLTEFSENQINKVGEVALNISENIFKGTRNISNNAFDYAANTMNRSKLLNEIAQNMTKEQLEELNSYLKKIHRIPGRFFEHPIQELNNFTDLSLNLSLKSLERLTNFSMFLNKLTWANLEEIGDIIEKALDLQMSNAKNALNLGTGVIKHVYNSAKNISEMYRDANPGISMFLPKETKRSYRRGRTTKRPGLLVRIPVFGKLPGVSTIQELLDYFPKFEFFDNITRAFDWTND